MVKTITTGQISLPSLRGVALVPIDNKDLGGVVTVDTGTDIVYQLPPKAIAGTGNIRFGRGDNRTSCVGLSALKKDGVRLIHPLLYQIDGTKKVLVGWQRETEIGDQKKIVCAYEVATRKEDEAPEVLFDRHRKGVPLVLPAEGARIHLLMEHANFFKALLRDMRPGENVKKEWKVSDTIQRDYDEETGELIREYSKGGRVQADYNGQHIFCHGFNDYIDKTIQSETFQTVDKDGMPVKETTFFYQGKYIGSFYFARKKDEKWEIILKPETADPINKKKKVAQEHAQMVQFILSDQEEGSFFVREEWPVFSDGRAPLGQKKLISGLQICAKARSTCGRIVARGDVREVSFWRDRKAMEEGRPPIKGMKNIIIARKQPSGEFKIKREFHDPSRVYASFILSDQGGKRIHRSHRLGPRGKVEIAILGKKVLVQRFYGIRRTGSKKVYSTTYEISSNDKAGWAIKVVDFYETAKDRKSKTKRIVRMMISFRRSDQEWEVGQAYFDDKLSMAENITRIAEDIPAFWEVLVMKERLDQASDALEKITQRLAVNKRLVEDRAGSTPISQEKYMRRIVAELDRLEDLRLFSEEDLLDSLPETKNRMLALNSQISNLKQEILKELGKHLFFRRMMRETTKEIIVQLKKHYPQEEQAEKMIANLKARQRTKGLDIFGVGVVI